MWWKEIWLSQFALFTKQGSLAYVGYGDGEFPLFLLRRNLGLYLNRNLFNLLKPNVNYTGRTAPLTSKVAFYIFIQQI